MLNSTENTVTKSKARHSTKRHAVKTTKPHKITTAVFVAYVCPEKPPRVLSLHFLVLWSCRIQHLFGNRVVLNPGLGGMRDVAPAIISHEQTELNRVCCFQTLDVVFPKNLFSDNFNMF